MDLNNDIQGDGTAAPGEAGGLSPLDRIALEASGEEAAAAAAEEAALNPPDPHALDPAEAWGQIPLMLGGLLSIAMPELAGVYTQKACYAWGVGMAQVADKYGWDANKAIGPEIALLAVSVPLVVPTYFAIKRRRDEARKNAPRPADVVADLNDQGGMPAPGGFVDPA
jgi:hypothetical protein